MSGSGLDRRLGQARKQLDRRDHTPTTVATTFAHDDNIVSFATYRLGLDLYPRQATLLKVLTCAEQLFTSFDYDVVTEWTAGYQPVEGHDGVLFEGIYGTTPDLMERIRHCAENGRGVFREITLVAGRRSSKTFVSTIVTLFKVSQLLALSDPHHALGLPDGKQISLVAMSTNRDSAARDVFGDLRGFVQSTDVFDGLTEHVGADRIRFWTPAQVASGAAERGDRGLIVVTALSTTATAGRGPAVYGGLLDEAAHLEGMGATSTAAEIHTTLAPALAQFDDSFMILASSPWTKIGRFYEMHRTACEINPATGTAKALDSFTLQIPSWELYRNWENAVEIPMWPDGPTFNTLKQPVISPDSRHLDAQRERDLATYLVEYEGQWATVADRYLPEPTVDKIFDSLGDREFTDDTTPNPTWPYALHIDLSLSGDNSALILGHLEPIDGQQHVVVDRALHWEPRNYSNHQVDYDEIAEVAVELAVRFGARITLDQFQSMAMTDKIDARLATRGLSGLQRALMSPTVVPSEPHEKLARWELVKTIAAEGRLHAPYHQLLHDELSYLRRIDRHIAAPTSGPVTTDDLADAVSHVVVALNQDPQLNRFSDSRPTGGPSSWGPNPYASAFSNTSRARGNPRPRRPERGRHYR